ncbi:twitching motility protein PilT [Bacteroidia bacterium]|nr:twitching motility protein PilT [Bacteroidia bacterium]
MRMQRYLLDTHIVIWLLYKRSKIDKHILEDIEYFQYSYCVSVESLREIVTLMTTDRIDLNKTLREIVEALAEHQIEIVPIELRHIEVLEQLPIPNIGNELHKDPADRLLIAQAIADNYTIISADHKFPFYERFGLNLLLND